MEQRLALFVAGVALIVTLLVAQPVAATKNILDFGAVPSTNSSDYTAAAANGKALYDAVTAANADPLDRVAWIPSGVFAFLPFANFHNLLNVTIVLDGTLSCYDGPTRNWPNQTSSSSSSSATDLTVPADGERLNVLAIFASSGITLTSNTRAGTIEGNGLQWWWENILWQVPRPNMLHLESVVDSVFEHWTLRNAPRYHYKSVSQINGLIQNIRIEVDVAGQKALLAKAGHLTAKGIPTFPLNTDGIDVRGRNVTVRNCYVENFDDALCAKPSNQRSNMTDCTSDIVFEDSIIKFGVGATIGSVPPSPHVNCVRNIIFRRIEFIVPLKAIYVKPNPCPDPSKDGTGIIDNILYEDIFADSPVWWSIWVSTQQQHQPGANGTNTGCSFLFPLPGTKCPTYPCVPVTRLQLRNVYMRNALLSPGVLRCHPDGPCTGWQWSNVTFESATSWPIGEHFLCEAVVDPDFTNVTPNCVSNVSTAQRVSKQPHQGGN